MQRLSASFCLRLFLPSRLCFALLFSLPLVLIPHRPPLVIFHMPELHHISANTPTHTHTSLGMHAYLRHTLLIHWIIHRNTHTHLMSHTQMQSNTHTHWRAHKPQFRERHNSTNLSRSVSPIHYRRYNPAHLRCDQPPIRNPSSPRCV